MNKILRKLGIAGIFAKPQKIGNNVFQQSSSPTTNAAPNDYANTTTTSSPSSEKFFKKMKKFHNKKLFLLFIILLLILPIVYLVINNLAKSPTKTVAGINDKKIEIQNAKSSQLLNKEFFFPLKDANGKEISKLKYSIQSAEMRDEIIVKGQKASAVKGRAFLILNLKITNDYNRSVQINARDYIRLIVNNSSEKIAPDIHNDPVEIQAISTKYTRLGFPVNETDTNLTLQVGEIDGQKELIKLNLK